MKRNNILLVTCLAASALLQGCVSTKVNLYQKNADGTVTETKDVGFQFREALPYLLVTSGVVTAQETALYTYDAKYGFVPVCDQPVTDVDSLKEREKCLARRAQVTNDQSPAKPKEPAAPTSSSESIGPRGAEIALAYQRHTQPVVLLAAATHSSSTKKGAAGKTASQADMDAKIKADLAAAKAKPTADDPNGTDTAKKADSTSSQDATQQGTLQIVYLPSPCRLYAVTQTNFLSTAKLNLALTNGWQLTTVGVETDSTAVVGKLLDTVGSIVGSLKGSSTGGGAPKGGGGATPQALGENLYARTETRYLAPGLYPLADCSKNGFSLNIPAIPTVSKVEWTLAFPKDSL
jgi:hypothetical protein